jgi:hypothetical protein
MSPLPAIMQDNDNAVRDTHISNVVRKPLSINGHIVADTNPNELSGLFSRKLDKQYQKAVRIATLHSNRMSVLAIPLKEAQIVQDSLLCQFI